MVVMLARATVLIGTLLAWSMATTMHATASCAVEPGPHDPTAGARVAFVGTVVSATDDQHRALVRVESVWRGPQLSAEVTVESDVLPPPGVGIEDLAIFNPGWRYLFVPENTSQPFKFPGCGGPIQYSSDLDRYRPGTAHPPLTASGVSDALQLAWFFVLSHIVPEATILLLATLYLLVWRRRRSRTPKRTAVTNAKEGL
jgi:hypothetical protein